MNKDLLSVTATTVLACAALQASAADEPESAANRYMHQADFEKLAARFEDPARAEWQKPAKVIASLGSLKGKTVADIGAGTGYFAFPIAEKAAKVIAIDIDQRFLDYIKQKKEAQKIGGNVETRLTAPDSAGLKPGEADLILIVDTWHHIERRIEYLRKLRQGLSEGGALVIIDFKKIEASPGPPLKLRLAPEEVESELRAAGFTIVSDDKDMLPYQYIIRAR